MNTLFALLFLLCTFLLLCLSPESFLAAMLDGGGKAATLCLSLVASYAVWMGLMKLWEDSGVAKGVSKLFKPIARRLLQTDDAEILSAASMSFSVNMLGISGAATPYGVKTAQLLDKTDNAEYASAMFFVLNATSLQLLPTSMVAVRVAMGSANPTDIIIPSLLTTLFSTVLGVSLTIFFLKPKNTGGRYALKFVRETVRKTKKIGAGTR